MTELMQSILTNPEQVTFTALFVGLLVWTMKTNQERETRYREREDKLQEVNNEREERYQKMIDDLTTALKGYDDVRATVERIDSKLN